MSHGLKSVYEIDGYGVVLPMVQNYYPVENNDAGGFYWGFKYTSGVFEYFQYADEGKAKLERDRFIVALDSWHGLRVERI